MDEQSDIYLWKGRWPALGRGFNTGVMLINLKKLRLDWHWPTLWRQVVEKELITMVHVTLGDQVITLWQYCSA